MVGSVALLVARRTNDREIVGSRPTKVVCITVLTGNRMGVNCPLPYAQINRGWVTLGPNLGVFPLEQTRHVGVAKSERPRLTNCEINFEEFQPM